ncbi:MAG: relaxase/mobilization nuclease domain-containing protein [Paraprevotella sp.]|nr:relaxase/mobilization nuclease domain-containing protein [Paraprevotella sp.]
MERMGIVGTPYIVVRHLDKDYPHCHIVFSHINNHAETISDKNDFERNKDICLDLTKEYGLHISDSKRQTNVNKLRGNEKIRYEILNTVDAAWNDRTISTLEQIEAKLKASGVGVEYKFKRGTNEVQRLWYTRKGKCFPASKWMYAIVPIKSYKGVQFIQTQVNDYVAGKTIRVDGCQGNYSTLYIKFDPYRMIPDVYNSNPDIQNQTHKPQSQGAGITLSSPSFKSGVQDDQGFASGNGISDDFKLWLSRHLGLSIDEALHRYRDEQETKQRRSGPKLH